MVIDYQGQTINRSDNLLDSDWVKTGGWTTLRVTASGRHFYGYQNGKTIVYTHKDETEAGRTFFCFLEPVKVRLIGSGLLQ